MRFLDLNNQLHYNLPKLCFKTKVFVREKTDYIHSKLAYQIVGSSHTKSDPNAMSHKIIKNHHKANKEIMNLIFSAHCTVF